MPDTTVKWTEEAVVELMKPRYKVIADWPGRQFFIGSILHIHEPIPDGRLRIFIDHKTENQKEWYLWNTDKIGAIESYPHLFKKLEWWEERKPEEMPGYVKILNQADVLEVHKAVNWNMNNGMPYIKGFGVLLVRDMLPATEKEYLQYQQTK